MNDNKRTTKPQHSKDAEPSPMRLGQKRKMLSRHALRGLLCSSVWRRMECPFLSVLSLILIPDRNQLLFPRVCAERTSWTFWAKICWLCLICNRAGWSCGMVFSLPSAFMYQSNRSLKICDLLQGLVAGTSPIVCADLKHPPGEPPGHLNAPTPGKRSSKHGLLENTLDCRRWYKQFLNTFKYRAKLSKACASFSRLLFSQSATNHVSFALNASRLASAMAYHATWNQLDVTWNRS